MGGEGRSREMSSCFFSLLFFLRPGRHAARIQSRLAKLPEFILDKGRWTGAQGEGEAMRKRAVRDASNTRGGACNSKAAPYFNIVASYIMFQQNGRRTRGSASADERVGWFISNIQSHSPSPPPPVLPSPSRFNSSLPRRRRTEREGREERLGRS